MYSSRMHGQKRLVLIKNGENILRLDTPRPDKSIDLSGLRAVVLDEADEMLDLGFREDLEFILNEAPEDRQTLLFSATVPKSITALAKSYQRDAVRVVTKSEAAQHADISYRAMTVADRDAECHRLWQHPGHGEPADHEAVQQRAAGCLALR